MITGKCQVCMNDVSICKLHHPDVVKRGLQITNVCDDCFNKLSEEQKESFKKHGQIFLFGTM